MRALTALAAVLVGALAATAITAAALTVGALAANATTTPIALITHGPKQDAPHELPLPAVPLLAITVTDAVTSPRPGDALTYTITLTNHERLALPMQIRLTPPPALTGAKASDGGASAGAALAWPVTLAPGSHATLHFTATVTDPAPSSRLAITACSYIAGSDRPTACASDLDQITTTPAMRWPTLAWIGGAFVALLAGVFLWRRLRPAPPLPRTAADDPSLALARQVVAELQSPRDPTHPAEPATTAPSDRTAHH